MSLVRTLTRESRDPIAALLSLYSMHGDLSYGESVTQLEHALQCATLAEAEGASAPLVTAAFLHDLGHLLHHDAAQALADGHDDHHESLGAKHLARWFVDAVHEPIALHVQAKRYLCHREPGYLAQLSKVSARTLDLQGGPMNESQAHWFERLPHADDALRLRRWDEQGKEPSMKTGSLSHFLTIAARCLREPRR